MSTYCETADIEAIFGPTNIGTWSDLDNDGDSDKKAARITQSIAVASERIDDAIRKTNYAIPLKNEGGTTPVSITDLAATLAGLWLYEARGSQDFNPNTGRPYHRLAFKRTEALRALDEIRSGQRLINALSG